jgi:hypothetical protein
MIVNCSYPFERVFPNVAAWYARVSTRPAFEEAAWRDEWFLAMVLRARSSLSNVLGVGIASSARCALPVSARGV